MFEESVEITPDWVVKLLTPECELQMEDCSGRAMQGMRVHGCAFHYVCNSCAHAFLRRVSNGYSMYKNMRCATCKQKFTRNSKYFNLVKL